MVLLFPEKSVRDMTIEVYSWWHPHWIHLGFFLECYLYHVSYDLWLHLTTIFLFCLIRLYILFPADKKRRDHRHDAGGMNAYSGGYGAAPPVSNIFLIICSIPFYHSYFFFNSKCHQTDSLCKF